MRGKNGKKHIRVVYLTIVIILFAFSVYGQSNFSGEKSEDKSIRRSPWSVQFRIDENFTLSSFEGMLFSCKRQMTDRSAIRLGLGLSTAFSDDNMDQYRTDTGFTYMAHDYKVDRDDFTAEISMVYIYQSNSESKLSFFWGVGPNIVLNLLNYDYTRNYYNNDGSIYNITENSHNYDSWQLGLLGIAGFEWFLSKKISLTSEYGLLTYYEWYNREYIRNQTLYQRTDQDITDGSQFGINSTSVKFGLSVYL